MGVIKEEERYTITPLGVLYNLFGLSSAYPEEALGKLELHARRFFQEKGKLGAIVFAEEGAQFISVEVQKDE